MLETQSNCTCDNTDRRGADTLLYFSFLVSEWSGPFSSFFEFDPDETNSGIYLAIYREGITLLLTSYL